MEPEEILFELEKLKNTRPNVTVKEYWDRVNKIAEEDVAFKAEEKSLKMSNEEFHRPFTI